MDNWSIFCALYAFQLPSQLRYWVDMKNGPWRHHHHHHHHHHCYNHHECAPARFGLSAGWMSDSTVCSHVVLALPGRFHSFSDPYVIECSAEDGVFIIFCCRDGVSVKRRRRKLVVCRLERRADTTRRWAVERHKPRRRCFNDKRQ